MLLKRSFTLIEVFICVAVLSLVAGLFSIKIKQMLDYYRFERSASRLLSELSFTKQLALSHQTDIFFNLEAKEGRLWCQRETDEPFGKQILAPFFLDFIDSFTFKAEKQKTLSILFSGSGWIDPLGKLAVISPFQGEKIIDIEMKPQFSIQNK